MPDAIATRSQNPAAQCIKACRQTNKQLKGCKRGSHVQPMRTLTAAGECTMHQSPWRKYVSTNHVIRTATQTSHELSVLADDAHR